jgi:hypothetical protein
VDGTKRWRENWRAVAPSGATRVDVPRSRRARRELASTLRALPEGAPVVVGARAPLANRRSRKLAASGGIRIEVEYLALPSAEAPVFLVEDDRSSISYFLRVLLVAPPAGRLTPIVAALVALARSAQPWRVTRILSPGRVLVGRRA